MSFIAARKLNRRSPEDELAIFGSTRHQCPVRKAFRKVLESVGKLGARRSGDVLPFKPDFDVLKVVGLAEFVVYEHMEHCDKAVIVPAVKFEIRSADLPAREFVIPAYDMEFHSSLFLRSTRLSG